MPAQADGYQMTDFGANSAQYSAGGMNSIEAQLNGSHNALFHHRELAPMPQGAQSADTGINSNNQRNSRSRGSYQQANASDAQTSIVVRNSISIDKFERQGVSLPQDRPIQINIINNGNGAASGPSAQIVE